MKLKLIITILFLSEFTFGQGLNFNEIIGQKYTSNLGHVFSLLDENKMISDLNGYGDSAIYWINSDTVFAKQTYGTTGTPSGEEDITHFYKFKKIDSNEIVLINYGFYDRNYHKEKVDFTFTNNKFLDNNIENFEYVNLEYLGPFWGYSKLKIYNNGNVEFYYDTYIYGIFFMNYSHIDTVKSKGLKRGKLNKTEFSEFRSALRTANIQNSSKNRWDCGMDRHDFNFTLKINSKIFHSLGCNILYQQRPLVEFHNRIVEKFIVHIEE